jgi:RNA-directed DNA polymerase
MIRYADDFVVLVRGTEAQAHAIRERTAEFMAEQMRLTLSPEKTAITHVDDGFDLLGFRVKRAPWRAKKRVAYTFPSQRALRTVMHRIKMLTNRSTVNLSLDQLIHALNPILRGWANYYRHAASSRCFAYLSPNPPIPAAPRHRGRSPEPIGRDPSGSPRGCAADRL